MHDFSLLVASESKFPNPRVQCLSVSLSVRARNRFIRTIPESISFPEVIYCTLGGHLLHSTRSSTALYEVIYCSLGGHLLLSRRSSTILAHPHQSHSGHSRFLEQQFHCDHHRHYFELIYVIVSI